MSAKVKSVLYMTGIAVFGGAMYLLLAGTTKVGKFQEKLQESQGILKKDRIESNKSTLKVLTKLQEVAGLDSQKK